MGNCNDTYKPANLTRVVPFYVSFQLTCTNDRLNYGNLRMKRKKK